MGTAKDSPPCARLQQQCPWLLLYPAFSAAHTHLLTLPLQAAAQTPRTPHTPNTPLTPKLTGTSSCGPQFFEAHAPQHGAAATGSACAAPGGPGHQQYGLELFLASEASAVVEHTKQ